MEQKNFNPMLWADVNIDVETLVEKIVEGGRDITAGYDNWLRLGFALADGREEDGRRLFHQLSRMNADYEAKECDSQYDACLKNRGKGGGVTIATLFQMAKEAGIDISNHRKNTEGVGGGGGTGGNMFTMETFTDKVAHADLPAILRSVVEECDSCEEADMMVLGTLVSASGVIPTVYGVYDRRCVYAPLFGCIVAPPASSKGRLTACLRFVEPIQDEIRQANRLEIMEYKQAMAAFQAQGKKANPADAPEQPPFRSLLIPANSSATASYQAIYDNGGEGLTFETEGDIMASTLKSDYGDYSTGLRAAFHHEPIVYSRRRDNEHVDIQSPRWAVMLTGTANQVANLVPDAENGLFSRFIFYMTNRNLQWRDVFSSEKSVIDDTMLQLGKKHLEVYHALRERSDCPIEFKLSKKQKCEFNAFFDELQYEQAAQIGDDMIASVRRLGLICFRLAMVLSVLRMADDDLLLIDKTDVVVCDDRDFHTAMTMVNVLVSHTAMVYSTLLKHSQQQQQQADGLDSMTDNQRKIFKALNDEFTTKDVIDLAATHGLTRRTAENLIGSFLTRHKVASRVKQGLYRKVIKA